MHPYFLNVTDYSFEKRVFFIFSLYFFWPTKKYFFKERKKLLDSETRHFEQVFFLLHLALSTKGVNGNWADCKGCIEIACNLAPKA